MTNGVFSLERGNLREAETFFVRALHLDSKLLQANLYLAKVALRSGDTAKAESHVDHVLVAEPGIAHAYYLKARILARKGERGRALGCLKKAVELSPGFEEAGRLLFLLLKNPGWTLCEIDMPDSWKMAVAANKKGDFKKMHCALLNYAAASGAGPSAELFKAYCMLSHYGKACETLALLASSSEARRGCGLLNIACPWGLEYNLPRLYFMEHARKLEKEKPSPEQKGLMDYLKCTLAMNFHGPAQEAALARLGGLIEKGKGKYDFARYITGWNSLCEGRYDMAAADFRNILLSGYRHLVVQCRLGETLLCKGEIRLGLAQFKSAYSAAPAAEKESVLAWEGEMRLFLKQYPRAVRLLKNNSCLHAACWLGAAYLEMGDFENALIELEKAVAASPDDAEARTWLGEAYRRCGRRSEALRELKLAASLSGGKERNVWVCLNKALLFADSGDTVKMKCNFALAVSAWPEPLSLARKRLDVSGALRGADIVRVTEYTLKMCGGYRRTDKYFLPLILGIVPAGKTAGCEKK